MFPASPGEASREAVNSHVALARGRREKIDYSARFNGLTNRRLKPSAHKDVKTPSRFDCQLLPRRQRGCVKTPEYGGCAASPSGKAVLFRQSFPFRSAAPPPSRWVKNLRHSRKRYRAAERKSTAFPLGNAAKPQTKNARKAGKGGVLTQPLSGRG